MKILRLLAVASAAVFFASSALAQTSGTVTNHAFALGKGAGQTGYTSLLCGSAQLAVGQAAADPICRTITGDVTLSAAGVTAIGTAKVTSAMLRDSVALSVIGRSANSTGVPADITCTAASDAVLRESGSVLGCGTVATAGIANNAITDAKIRQGAARSLIGVAGNATANVADIAAASDNQIMRRSGTSIAFGSIDLSQSNAVGSSLLALANGGCNAALTASNGGILWSNASQCQILAGTANASRPLLSGSTATPSWAAFSLPGSVTSGGVAYFSSTSAMSSSALLAANQLVLGGGAGTAPATLGSLGTTTTVLHGNAAGAPTFGQIVAGDVTANTLTNATLATMAAYTFKGNATGSTAAPTDVDIGALTLKASPVGTDELMVRDNAASGAWKRSPLSAVASAGSVASINGQTGALTLPVVPQGRLTLQTATPVMTTTQSAKTTIFYTAYEGNQVPIYDGTNMVSTTITGGEISVLTTDTTKSPAAIGASKVNDWFVWNDSGTIRIGHGPDWTSDTARSAGTALVRVNGILLNNATITNGPAASRGTYVGTTRSNGSSQLDWIIGGSASGGVAGFLGVWNAYNRVTVSAQTIDNGVGYTYTSGTIRQARASAGNQISAVFGLAEDSIDIKYSARVSLVASGAAVFSIGVDSTSTSFVQGATCAGASGSGLGTTNSAASGPLLGLHVFSANEQSDASNAHNFNVASLNALSVMARM